MIQMVLPLNAKHADGMQVISVDVPQYDAQFSAAKRGNFELLNRILGGITSTIRHVSDPLDLLGAFKSKEYSATAYFSGPFRIADSMTIKVKVHNSDITGYQAVFPSGFVPVTLAASRFFRDTKSFPRYSYIPTASS